MNWSLFLYEPRTHSFLICFSEVIAATALAFLTIQVKEGMAIALKIERTETTTTNSRREKPSVSIFFLGKIYKLKN